jgi:molybdopterin-binding protein
MTHQPDRRAVGLPSSSAPSGPPRRRSRTGPLVFRICDGNRLCEQQKRKDIGICRAICGYAAGVASYRIKEAAALLGVSDDTVRRWAETGRIDTTTDGAGRRVIDGAILAAFAEELAQDPGQVPPGDIVAASVRNRFTGLVTRVVKDTVMAQVEIQSGPHRIVSLMSREAADELRLEPGVLAVAAVKATNVSVEIPRSR